LNKLFLSALTKAINSYLDLDPESRQRLKKLHGKAITIEFLPLHFTFQCLFNEDSVNIQTDETYPTDTKIRGTPLQMLAVAMTKDNRHRFFAEDLIIEGNAELGQQVIELFDELSIDWEDHLSRFVGDVPAYHAGRIVRRINTWLGHTEESLTQNMNEYIHEEAKWLPTREALQDFFSEVDLLRMDVDRIEARIKHLCTKIIEDEAKQ
jgi:ubiquinone biosynthesis accessory factor UbiJ